MVYLLGKVKCWFVCIQLRSVRIQNLLEYCEEYSPPHVGHPDTCLRPNQSARNKIIIIFNPKLGHISITDNFEGIYYMMTKNTIGNDAMCIWTILEYWLFNLYMINSIVLMFLLITSSVSFYSVIDSEIGQLLFSWIEIV